MTKDELSESEIKLLEDMANNVRLMPCENRDAIKHALKIVKADKKADDEPKPKFKVGDRVRFGEVGKPMQSGVIMEVHSTGTYSVFSQDGKMRYVPEEALNRDTEPTVEEEDENKQSGYLDFSKGIKAVLDGDFNPIGTTPIKANPIRITNDYAWQSYRMELATKIAVAYAEKGRYKPYEIGANAVEVANGVVERLKNGKV